MWSRFNAVGMRRRWCCDESDPGRVSRSAAANGGNGAGNGRKSASGRIARDFLDHHIVMDCQHPGCPGKLFSDTREFAQTGARGSSVVLRCSREPEAHEARVGVDPFTPEEIDELKSALIRGEMPGCPRCETAMEYGSVEVEDAFGGPIGSSQALRCSWCGSTWQVPAQLQSKLAKSNAGRQPVGDDDGVVNRSTAI